MHKGKMYACYAFFQDGSVKRWKYVTNLTSFADFLTKSHSTWKYFNVYDKGTRIYMKRFYPGNIVPKELESSSHALAKIKATYSPGRTDQPKPYENTFSQTIRKASEPETTFTNGFNNSATIPTPEEKGGGLC